MAIPESDPYYRTEVVTAPLKWFMFELARRLEAASGAVGIKGSRLTHFRGGHRSWNFIKFSPYCTNRVYTVSRTPGDRNPANKNAIAAGDLTLVAAKLIWLCGRVDAAARTGNFEGLTEWYGNDDGDNRVDGFDNIANVLATSDDTHLWHIHMTFDRDIVEDMLFFERLLTFIFEEEDMERDEVIRRPQNLNYPSGNPAGWAIAPATSQPTLEYLLHSLNFRLIELDKKISDLPEDTVILSPEQVQQLVDGVSAKVVAADNSLTEEDLPAIKEQVKAAIREGTGVTP